MINIVICILIGLIAGAISGLVGIGGGVIIVPALIFLFGFTQHKAQGTTLALMIPPIGLLAAWTYYKQGAVDIKTAFAMPKPLRWELPIIRTIPFGLKLPEPIFFRRLTYQCLQ